MSTDFFKISRRTFFKGLGYGSLVVGAGALGYRSFLKKSKYRFPGQIVGANFKVGHLLRKGVDLKPTQAESVNTVIVGGGISGLSAAWWFKKNNFNNFKLFEMDTDVGGNSCSGKNAVSAYPWGAHYVPLPGPDAHYVHEFFRDVGVITGYKEERPVYNDYYLCSEMSERLYFQGEWREGLVPQYGIEAEDRRHYSEFFSYIDLLRNKKGKDQKYLFTIPIDMSSQDIEFLDLDKISMDQFLRDRGWTSRYLHWYVNYCCRDDYGMPIEQVSAWAGLHYFAARSGVAANADSQTVLTWPEGNGFLVSKLFDLCQEHVQKKSLVFSIEASPKGATVDVLNTDTQVCTRYTAKHVVYCGPRYAANRVIKNYENPVDLNYAPWMVANITLNNKPDSEGVGLAWDNVSFYSRSLGYIVATHQDLKINRSQTVVSYYLPLDQHSPKRERISAYQKTHQDWVDIIVPDLEQMHPGISQSIENIDVWVWGHGMVSPGIDYLWNSKRQKMMQPFGSIEFAHSDMSGVSIFEEAQYRGVVAARNILHQEKIT